MFVPRVEAAGEAALGTVMAGEAIPPYLAVHASGAGLRPEFASDPPAIAPELPRLAGRSLQALAVAGQDARQGWRKYLPVFYSLVLPGTGEISLGAYKRGAALVAAEATAWTGYSINRNRGLDSRVEFEAFADKHWDHDRFVREHVATEMIGGDPTQVTFAELDLFGQSAAYQGVWPPYHSYSAKADDKGNYYENIGKYNWFISGWEDWNRAAPGNPQQMDTALRDQYRSIRNRSNDQLDRADRFIYLSIAARVFSLVETVIMVRSRDAATAASAAPSRRYSLTARSTGLASGEIAFEYRFR